MTKKAPNSRNATLLERVAQERAKLGISERDLSLRVTGKPDFIRDLKRRGSIPDAEKLAAMAHLFDVSSDWLLGLSENREPIASEVRLGDVVQGYRDPAPLNGRKIPLVGTGDCAALEFEDETGALVDIERSSFDPDHVVKMIKRPEALSNSIEIFAIYYQGESMMPRFEPGEIGIVDPTRPARPGDYVLVQLNNGESDDVASVLAKRLISASSREVWLEQFNPPAKFKVPRTRVARLQRIMPPTDLLMA